MCQLLGLNSAKPASIAFSLRGFVLRGGATGDHRDGWGVACSDGDSWRRFTDCSPSSDSRLMECLISESLRARSFIVHIRKATVGAVMPQNCHPFVRELWGRTWVFAHNGDLKGFDPALPGTYQPVGTTDSERAFCFLLQALVSRFGEQAPEPAQLFEALQALAREVAHFGTFNFLLSDGRGMYAFCTTDLHVLQRAYPFARARLVDVQVDIDFAHHNHLDDRMAIIATHPLTDEPWAPMQSGELRYFRNGAHHAVDAPARRTFAVAF